MPTLTDMTGLIFPESMPVGSDFAGGAEFLPVKPAPPGQIVPGSDFAGGAMPLATEDNQRAPSGQRVADNGNDGSGFHLTSPLANPAPG